MMSTKPPDGSFVAADISCKDKTVVSMSVYFVAVISVKLSAGFAELCNYSAKLYFFFAAIVQST